MTTTFITTNTIGAGAQFNFAASGDALVVLQNVTLGSTNAAAINPSIFTDVEITVLGTLISSSIMALPTNSSFTVGAGASFISFEANGGSAALYLGDKDSLVQIDGTMSAQETIGILASGGTNTVIVTGSVSAASGVFIGLGASAGDILVNAGSITASAVGDALANTRFNNAVFTEGSNTQITNLAGGTLTATSSAGNGVRIGDGGSGSIVTNHGTITSVNAAGIDFTLAGLVSSFELINTGLIQGASVAVNGAGSGSSSILNSGHMIGDVLLGLGNDTFDARGGRIDGLWSGADGADRYDGRGASLISGTISGGFGNDTLLGGDGAETISGDTNLDAIRGGGGEDLLYGGLNSDFLTGDDGDDQLYGGDDFDDMSGGAGDDTLQGDDGALIAHGGAGNDRLMVDSSATATFIEARGGSGDDVVQGGLVRDNIYGGSGDDQIYSDDGGDLVYGGSGDDAVDAFNGDDTVYGGAGDDDILNAAGHSVLYGGLGFDTMSAGGGNDRIDGGGDGDILDGGIGLDTLNGGSGDDQVQGGAGRDNLTGGTGADQFVYAVASESGATVATRDIITDFRSGLDRIDLGALDANANVADNQAFTYIGSGPFTNVAGQLRYSAVTGLLQADQNGDGIADFSLLLQNLPSLIAGDLVL